MTLESMPDRLQTCRARLRMKDGRDTSIHRPKPSGRLLLLFVDFLELGVDDLVILRTATGMRPTVPTWRWRLLRLRLLGLVHRLADLHRRLAEPVRGTLERLHIGPFHRRFHRRDRRLGLALLLGADLVAVLGQVLLDLMH